MSGKLVSDWQFPRKKKGLGLGAVIRKAFCVHVHTPFNPEPGKAIVLTQHQGQMTGDVT